MVQPNRLFFALLPTLEARTAIETAVKDLSMRQPHGGKVVRVENLHLTLMFLGDAVPPEEEAAAIKAASTIAVPPLSLSLDHGATFAGNTSTWWLGTRSPPEALQELRRKLHASLVEHKVGYDRQRFVPHVTIVRHAKSRLANTSVRPIGWNVGAFHLMRSPIGEAGSAYETIASWSLEIRSNTAAGQLQLL